MLIYFQYLSSIQSFFQLLHDYQRCVHLEVLLLFCLSLLNTQKNLPKFLKGLLICFRHAHTFQIMILLVTEKNSHHLSRLLPLTIQEL